MRQLVCLAAFVSALLAGQALAEGQWTPTATACSPTLEKWLATHGTKFRNGREQLGAFVFGEVRWNNGVIAEVTVGPSVDPSTGEPAFCVIASRFVAREEVQAELGR